MENNNHKVNIVIMTVLCGSYDFFVWKLTDYFDEDEVDDDGETTTTMQNGKEEDQHTRTNVRTYVRTRHTRPPARPSDTMYAVCVEKHENEFSENVFTLFMFACVYVYFCCYHFVSKQ